jgi:hypothetical protein
MLSLDHRLFLAARAVTGPVLGRRGYDTVTDPAVLVAAGFPESQARRLVPGLLIPRYALDGRRSWPKFRPDTAGRNGPVVNRRGDEIKYASPGGSSNFVDVLPGTPMYGWDVWLSVEGFIKADAMTAAGAALVAAVDGVWGWRSQGDVVVGLSTLVWPGRWFHVVADSDWSINPMVAVAVGKLAVWLRSQGAQVRVLHPPAFGAKVGVDDFLAAGGSLDGLVEERRPSPALRRERACEAAGRWRR